MRLIQWYEAAAVLISRESLVVCPLGNNEPIVEYQIAMLVLGLRLWDLQGAMAPCLHWTSSMAFCLTGNMDPSNQGWLPYCRVDPRS